MRSSNGIRSPATNGMCGIESPLQGLMYSMTIPGALPRAEMIRPVGAAPATQRLARLYERKHAALEALKKSLLHQAFTGAL